MKGNAERGGSTPKHYGNRCSIPVWTPVNPTNPQNLGIHGATPKRGCAEMEASTIKQNKTSKHCGNRCSIPPANQAKPKNTGIDGATPKMGCKSPQNTADWKGGIPKKSTKTVENMQTQPNPKKAGIDGATPKGAASHLNTLPQSPKKGCKSNNKLLKLQDLQKIHQNTTGIDGAYTWEHLQTQTQKCKNRWRNPQKWLQVTSKHSWKGGIPKKSSKAPRE